MGKKCNGVFEGGGVKGIGFAGAISEFEAQGYEFQNVAGTSAGAIAAALVAAGYSGMEIERELKNVDLKEFRQESRLDRLGNIGKIINLLIRYGIYKTDTFESWLGSLLKKKKARLFGDIKTGETGERFKYKFQAVASDLTDYKMLLLPRDLKDFGINPDEFEIAKAVRMSISIPFFYEPYRLVDSMGRVHLIADGGLLSNYPIWVLDDGQSAPSRPTFGFKFYSEGEGEGDQDGISNFVEYSKSILTTMMDACDKYHISVSNGDYQRSVLIPSLITTANGSKVIKTTYFDITPEESAALAQNGRIAARRFLSKWDFNAWKAAYR